MFILDLLDHTGNTPKFAPESLITVLYAKFLLFAGAVFDM
jgi:hypothetical protein